MASTAGTKEPPAAPTESGLARAQAELRRLHLRWQCLTREEGAAITAADWNLVILLQTTKKNLRQEIATAEQRLREESKRCGADEAEYRREFRPIVEVSIQLESYNRDLMAVQLQQAHAQHQETNHVILNLRQLHHAYVHKPNSVWQSYS